MSDDRTERIRRVIETNDGHAGDVCEPRFRFVSIDPEGVVQVAVDGVAGCCPASAMPWVLELESRLRATDPDVRLVEVVE